MNHKIIFDTDPGVDDAMALLLAFSSPEIEVLGLTTIYGNGTTDSTTINALNLLNFVGRTDIPVARGASQPMVLPLGRLGEFVHGDDAMGNLGWFAVNNPEQKVIDKHAAQFIVETIMSNPGQITLVPVGPLTNIGLALQLEPRIAQNVRQVVLMGGNVCHVGNVSPLAEANIYKDPHAASLVFSAGWDLTMAGLDVTQEVLIGQSFFDALGYSNNRFGQFIARIIPHYQEFHRSRYGTQHGNTHTHDPSAIAYLIEPTLFEGVQCGVVVPTEGYAMGITLADRANHFYTGPKTNCLMKVDAPRFVQMFQERLTR
ncbi:MAG: nucleoside hydrolase [Anaerolineae bacterium]|nr:nucleoside hydrolase [Anaerolineae bacterium]